MDKRRSSFIITVAFKRWKIDQSVDRVGNGIDLFYSCCFWSAGCVAAGKFRGPRYPGSDTSLRVIYYTALECFQIKALKHQIDRRSDIGKIQFKTHFVRYFPNWYFGWYFGWYLLSSIFLGLVVIYYRLNNLLIIFQFNYWPVSRWRKFFSISLCVCCWMMFSNIGKV